MTDKKLYVLASDKYGINGMNWDGIEIIKAFECFIGDTDGKDCVGCPLYEIDDCQAHLNLAALDTINRQKAEIEMLNKANTSVVEHLKKARRQIKAAKAEAIKEFAERLKEYIGDDLYFEIETNAFLVLIEKLIYEMAGASQ